jgi:3-methyladenine DNA glycosylase AlkD
MRAEEVVAYLEKNQSQVNRDGMSRYGIKVDRAFGISMVALRAMAKSIGKDHQLALDLWETGYHESRLISTIIDVPSLVTEEQMEHWAGEFDSWDVCDQCCSNLFSRTPFAVGKANEWSGRDEEYVKRAGFVLMAALAVHDKKAADTVFLGFLGKIDSDAADDDRPMVRKAVNWALRQIGKHSQALHRPALALARKLAASENKAARWIGKDAVRELTDPAQLARLAARG